MKIDELDDVEVSTGSRETPDDGDYNLLIEESTFGPTSNGKGTGYKQKLTILDGPFQGTNIYNYINVSNPNATAQQIGRSQLKTQMTITGVDDSDELEGKMIRARLIGELQDYVKKNGERTKIVNLRPTILMDLDGNNAKGEKVPEFQPRSDNAKSQLAEWRDQNMGSGQASKSASSNQSNDSYDAADDDIPF